MTTVQEFARTVSVRCQHGQRQVPARSASGASTISVSSYSSRNVTSGSTFAGRRAGTDESTHANIPVRQRTAQPGDSWRSPQPVSEPQSPWRGNRLVWLDERSTGPDGRSRQGTGQGSETGAVAL